MGIPTKEVFKKLFNKEQEGKILKRARTLEKEIILFKKLENNEVLNRDQIIKMIDIVLNLEGESDLYLRLVDKLEEINNF